MAAALVQKLGTNTGASDLPGSRTITIPAAGVPVGHLIVVAVSTSGGTIPTSVVDTAGNTYSLAVSSAVIYDIFIYYTMVTAALVSGDTITVTVPGVVWQAEAAAEFSGILGLPLDKTAVNNGTGTAMDSGTTAVTSRPDELAVAAFANTGNVNTIVAPLVLLDTFRNAGHDIALIWGYLIPTANAAQNGDATNGASSVWEGAIVTFKASGASFIASWGRRPVPMIKGPDNDRIVGMRGSFE
jgi:hypothetical protein